MFLEREKQPKKQTNYVHTHPYT